jgi:ABC-2 type transport system ATP-binding protein
VSLAVRGVRFAYEPGRPVLAGVDLAAAEGEIVGLLGANGAGKTTLFRLLAGLLRPDAGEVEVAGVAVAADPREAKRRSAYVPDEPLLYPELSALENLDLFARLWGVPPAAARQRSETMLTAVGLWPVRNRWVRGYSRGMRQKLALCAALLHRPRVLLMDEPFTGLDVEGVLWARRLLRELTAAGGTVLFTSHTPEIVEALADRVAVLHRGAIAYRGTGRELREAGGLVRVFERVCGGGRELEVAWCAAS